MELESFRVFQYDILGRREIRLLQFNLRECTDRKLSCTLRTIALYDNDSSPRNVTRNISPFRKPGVRTILPIKLSSTNKHSQLVKIFTLLFKYFSRLPMADSGLKKGHYSLIYQKKRGHSFFLIDAICIDQNNAAERDAPRHWAMIRSAPAE